MIKLENVSYEIKGKVLVQNVSGHLKKGKLNLILGPNGAGKSTLIKLISGEIKPTQGKVLFEGLNLQQYSFKEMAQFRAVLSQNLELGFPLTVSEVVLMGRYPHYDGKPKAIDLEICKRSMQLLNLVALKNRNYLTLSGGEKQRTQCARVFAQIWQSSIDKSRLLLLDEPLTFLDIFHQYDLMNKIERFMIINPDLTVIGVVHDINIAAKYADTIMLLKNSKLFTYGDSIDVLTEKNIYEVFKVVVENCFKINHNPFML